MIKTWADFLDASLEEQKAYFEARRKAGLSDRDIGRELNACRSSVDLWKTQHGMQRGKKKRTSECFKRSDTLCWDCENCTGGCAWSRNFEPVEGWTVRETAEPTWIGKVQKMIPCITVVDCPEFVRG